MKTAIIQLCHGSTDETYSVSLVLPKANSKMELQV